MAAPSWSSFTDDLLNAAGIKPTDKRRQPLFDWNLVASSNCANNPVDISRHETGSTNCHKLTSTRIAQKYLSHASASKAFAGELRSGNFPHLLAALEATDPYAYGNPSAVVAELKTWGSPKYADYYSKNATGGSGAGGAGSSSGVATHMHKGWDDVQAQVNTGLPKMLHKVGKVQAATLRRLRHPHRLR